MDIIVTHAAPDGLGSGEDYAHRGFDCFRKLLDKYRPVCLIHGHVHMNYGQNIPRVIDYNGAKIINAYERYSFEIPDKDFPAKDRGQVIYKTRYRPGYLEEYRTQGW